MELAGVKVVTNKAVDAALLAEVGPEAVILATGARPRRPAIEGAESAHVVDVWQLLRGEVNVGASVLVADWRCDWIGMGVAEKLARDGCRVRLAINGYVPGQRIQQYVRDQWNGTLHKLGVEVIPYARLFGADGETVYLQHTSSGEPIICEGVDTVVLALGHEQEAGLFDSLDGLARRAPPHRRLRRPAHGRGGGAGGAEGGEPDLGGRSLLIQGIYRWPGLPLLRCGLLLQRICSGARG